MTIVENEKLCVRALTREDAEFLQAWLNDPQVLALYEGRDRPHNRDLIEEHFLRRLGGTTTQCIVEYLGIPIGYLQFYPLEPDSLKEFGYGADDVVYGMDQFIGDPTYWNQGLGTTMVMMVADFILYHLSALAVVMDPHTSNSRALRCYEKAGFRKLHILPKHELHEGEWRDCWLVERRA